VAFAAGFRLPLHVARHAAFQAASRLGIDVPRPIPFFVLKVTDVCNARCETCNLGLPAAYRSSAALPLSVATSIVQEMARRKTLFAGIVGGEPLLYKHLYELLEMCKRLEVRTNLNTHGGFLTKEVASRLGAAGLSYLSVSLDYPNAARNEAVRKGIKYDAVLEGIRAMKSECPDTAISIGMTVTRHNIGEIRAMCQLAARESVRYLKIQPFHSHLDQMTNAPDLRLDMALSIDDLTRLSDELLAVQNDANALGVLTNARMLLQELPSTLAGRRTLACVAGDAILFVEPSGRVGGCPEKRSQGSLKDMDLDSLMAAEPEIFQFAKNCPMLPSCFDTTYGELSHIFGRNDLRHTLDVIDRVLFYR
jgi:MoaA/NifB/PqqE/SkfB family radical SAM enzyme